MSNYKLKSIYILFLLFSSFFLKAQLTIIVNEFPINTPLNDNIYLAGDFNGWQPNSKPHQLIKDDQNNRHYLTLPISKNIAFKFTRGTWDKVESTTNGGFVENRTAEIIKNQSDTIYCKIKGWADLKKSKSTAANNVSILTDSFYIPQLNRFRRIWIYLPPNYKSSELKYPVLYMHDGQNVFDETTAYSGEWKVDETLNQLHKEGDKGIIVVAIDNGSDERLNEYSPWIHSKYGGGKGKQYVDFIVKILKPHIDDKFRTLSDRENTGIMGSSMGGLISMYAGVKHSAIFGKIGAFSPSYWFSKNSFKQIDEQKKDWKALKIYQIVGSEGSNMVNNTKKMHKKLLKIKGQNSQNTKFLYHEEGKHQEWYWAREFRKAYEFLYK